MAFSFFGKKKSEKAVSDAEPADDVDVAAEDAAEGSGKASGKAGKAGKAGKKPDATKAKPGANGQAGSAGEEPAPAEADAAADAAPDADGKEKAKDKKKETLPRRDTRKAQNFFRHAAVAADSRQYDYAIECYINGLRFDADNVRIHESLREVARRRKVNDGKPAGLRERLKAPRDPVDRMLHQITLWSKDPFNLKALLDAMEKSVDANDRVPEFNCGDVAYWIGMLLLEKGEVSKPAKKPDLIKLRDLLARIGAYDRAVEACQLALELDPEDPVLAKELQDLEAEATMADVYNVERIDEGFEATVKDLDAQRALDSGDQLSKGEQQMLDEINARRQALEDEPDNIDRRLKLIESLVKTEKPELEEEAIGLLEQAWEETGQYRHKLRIGDIRMRMLNRQANAAQKAYKEAGPDEDRVALKAAFQKLYLDKLKFEIREFQERIKNYPTELKYQFELGKRLYQGGKIEESIRFFQQAQQDHKLRPHALNFLGQAYIKQSWWDEAIDSFRTAVEAYPNDSDKFAKEVRYNLMMALEHHAKSESSIQSATEAQKIASQLMQVDISYKDVRQRLDALRDLVKSLKPAQATG